MKESKKRNPNKEIRLTQRHHFTSQTAAEIGAQADNIINFLAVVHPHVMEDAYTEAAIELRPLKRDKDEFEYVRSLSTFRFTGEKDREQLIKFLTKLDGKGFCLYYSIFAFDYALETFDSKGKKHAKGIINNENAKFTTTLMADFDGMGPDEFEKYKKLFQQIGIETYDIFTGNGVQSLILLNRRCHDKGILRKFTELLISKGFDVDSAIVEAARQARLAYTRNCKELDCTHKNFNPIDPSLPFAVPLNAVPRRYSLSEVFEALHSLPTIIPQSAQATEETSPESIQELENQTEALTQAEREEVKLTKKKQVEVSILEAKEDYSKIIDFNTLPPTAQRILASHTPHGIRNRVLMFLIPFMKNDLGLTIGETQAMLTIWGARCEVPIDENEIHREVARLWKYQVDYKQGYYTKELVEVYGYLDMDVLRDRSLLSVPHAFLKAFSSKSMNPGVVRLYILILVAFHKQQELVNVDIAQMVELANISEKTVKRHVSVLVNTGLLIRRKSNRRKGEPYIYYPSPIFRAEGSRKVPMSLIDVLYKYGELNEAEAMMYLYFKLELAYSRKGTIITSQESIAQANAKTQQNISQLTNILHEKEFIFKETKGSGFAKRTIYELLK